jgi:ElaB/YqjD/DUF883 family membrane-anchored ribosome-binding protein
MNRRTAPRVRRGRVQKKNNRAWTPGYYDSDQPPPVVDRRRPGEGYRHLLRRRDIEEFIAILPEWEELSNGLNAIVLAPGGDAMGWHEPGVVHVCAWEEGLWWNDTLPAFVDDHRELFESLDVVVETYGDRVVTKWTEAQARAFQLLHVLLHELGHHHDRMTTRSQRSAARGERFAEEYARRHEARIWDDYVRRFGL